MNKTVFIILISLCLCDYSVAQNPQQVTVAEVIAEMSKGTVTGFELFIPDQTYKSVKNDLSKYLRSGSKSRTAEASGELYITGALVKNISPSPVDIYTKAREVTDGVVITAFFTPDGTHFYSQAANPAEALAISKYLREFGIRKYRDAVKNELNEYKRQLKKTEAELDELVNEKQRSERSIRENERNIENNNRSIETISRLLASKEEELMLQREMVSKLSGTGSDEEKLAKSNLKKLEGEKRKLDKEKESLHRKNDNLSSQIENQKRNIDRNLKNQDDKKEEIGRQEKKIKAVEKKLEDIR